MRTKSGISIANNQLSESFGREKYIMNKIGLNVFVITTLIILSLLSVFIPTKHSQLIYHDDSYAMPESFSSGPFFPIQVKKQL